MIPSEQFPSNSKNVIGAKQPKERVAPEKVVTGEVIVRKKSLGKRFKDVFLGGSFKNAAQHVMGEVLLPALRNMIADAGTEGIRRIVFPDSQPLRRRDYRNSGYSPRTTYSTTNPLIRPGRDPRQAAYLPDQPPHMARHDLLDLNDIVIRSREEAEQVLDGLITIIDKFDIASVADYYDLLGLPTTYVMNSWGWTFLNNVVARQTRDGFVLDLPRPEPIR